MDQHGLSVFCFYGVILINLGIGALLMNALLLDGTVANQLMTTYLRTRQNYK